MDENKDLTDAEIKEIKDALTDVVEDFSSNLNKRPNSKPGHVTTGEGETVELGEDGGNTVQK